MISNDEYSKLLDQQFETKTNISANKIISGTILKINDQHVTVDIGYKSEGQIPREEFLNTGSSDDLKTGQIVGATPYRQQTMQIAGVAVASLVMAPIMQLLHENTPGGIGGRELAAPQAGLFASLAKGFFGDGVLPWNMVLIGCALGIIILIVDFILESKDSDFRLHLMPVAVGIYLPFGLSTPILIGGIIAHIILSENKTKGEPDNILQRGILLSSGLIAGESLMGILLAFIASAGIQNLSLNLDSSLISALTFVIALITIY